MSRLELLEKVLNWIETSHSNFPEEHDHHCAAGRWTTIPHPSGLLILAGPDKGKPLTRSVQVETEEPCTCGWTEAKEALAQIRALDSTAILSPDAGTDPHPS